MYISNLNIKRILSPKFHLLFSEGTVFSLKTTRGLGFYRVSGGDGFLHNGRIEYKAGGITRKRI